MRIIGESISHDRATAAIETPAFNCRSVAILNSFVNFRRDNPMTQILHSMSFEP
jgi:hypothetical protein